MLIKELTSETKLPGAILLNGGWGSGKTHFWKNNILPELRKTGTAYVSLFGANSSQKIKADLMSNFALNAVGLGAKADDTFSSFTKMAGNVFKIAGKAVNQIGKDNLGFDAIELFNAVVPEVDQFEFLPEGLVICIDDFERCSPDFYKEAFNIVNQLVEHRNCKVIILGDMSKFKTKHDDYNEKIFHKTLVFRQELEDVFDKIVLSYSGPEGKKAIPKFKKVILDAFAKGESKNIRTLSKVISYISQLFENGIKPTDHHIRQITYLTIYKSDNGALINNYTLYQPRTGAAKAFKNHENKRNKKTVKKEDKISVEFYEKFYGNSCYDNVFTEQLFYFIAIDELDVSKLKREINPPNDLDLAEKLCISIGSSGSWIHLKESELREIASNIKLALTKKYSKHNSMLMSYYEFMVAIHTVLGLDVDLLEKQMFKYIDDLPVILNQEQDRFVRDEKYKLRVDRMYRKFTESQINKRREAFINDVLKSIGKKEDPELYGQYNMGNRDFFLQDAALDPRVVTALEKLFKTRHSGIFSRFYATVSYQAARDGWSADVKKRIKANLDSVKTLDMAEKNIMNIFFRNMGIEKS